MRVTFPSGSRNNPLDRNPSTVIQGAAATSTGGADTQVFTYTVPANRRADLAIQTSGVIITALVAAQGGFNRLLVTPSGGANTTLFESEFEPAAAVGTRGDTPSIHVQLKAGDQVQARVVTGAGAGVLGVKGGVQGVEYDA